MPVISGFWRWPVFSRNSFIRSRTAVFRRKSYSFASSTPSLAGIPTEVLQVRVLLDHKGSLFIRESWCDRPNKRTLSDRVQTWCIQGFYSKTGKIGDIAIDIVNCGWQLDELRIYADRISPEQAAEIVKYASPVMDPNVSSEEFQDVLDYLSGVNDYHDGYFGNLCMTFNEIYGELMLRTD